jgi:hypothetical protein
VEARRHVGENARPVSQLADELGVGWWTIMNAVIEHGTPLVDDPGRIGVVRQLGVDETSFLAANRHHPTLYATGLVDLQRHVVIDMVEGSQQRNRGNPRPTTRRRSGPRRPSPAPPSPSRARIDRETRQPEPARVPLQNPLSMSRRHRRPSGAHPAGCQDPMIEEVSRRAPGTRARVRCDGGR